MTSPIGAFLTPILDAAPLLTAIFDGGNLPEEVSGYNLCFAVLQCTDTFVWGIPASGENEIGWVWSSDADSALRPPCLENLLEARVFGPDAEVLVWRGDSGSMDFVGRLATDGDISEDKLLAPLDRMAAFTGHCHTIPGLAFQRWTTDGGKVTVTPLGSHLRIREYLCTCDNTGVVRIAMTRFLEIS
jgi:hypothetical protein